VAISAATLTLEHSLASTVGLEAAMVGSSTLHLLCDVMATIAGDGTIVIERGAYRTSWMAVERKRGLRADVLTYRNRDLASLWSMLDRRRAGPVFVVTDALSGLGIAAPLAEIVDGCARRGATVVVDDSQGIGLLGEPAAGLPYGRGGLGSLTRVGRRGASSVILVASLIKGFGIPLAFVAARKQVIDRIASHGDTAWSSSPPDLPSQVAATRALHVNATVGENARRTLAESVILIDEVARTQGSGAFPVRSRRFGSNAAAARYHAALADAGLFALFDKRAAAVRFVVTAAHTGPVLARALDALDSIWRRLPRC
jgi:8-amino-7-oxononanoate synthase